MVTSLFMSSYLTQLHDIQGVLRKELLTICFKHTSLSSPVHFLPSPEYPALHAQVYDPIILLHTALTPQLLELAEHSSISAYEHVVTVD